MPPGDSTQLQHSWLGAKLCGILFQLLLNSYNNKLWITRVLTTTQNVSRGNENWKSFKYEPAVYEHNYIYIIAKCTQNIFTETSSTFVKTHILAPPAQCVSLPFSSHNSSELLLVSSFIVLQSNAGPVRGTSLDLLCQLGSTRLPLQELFWVVPL